MVRATTPSGKGTLIIARGSTCRGPSLRAGPGRAHHTSTPRLSPRKTLHSKDACTERRGLSGEAGKARSRSGQGGIRTPEGVSQQIYSLPPLAAWVPARFGGLRPQAPGFSDPRCCLRPGALIGAGPPSPSVRWLRRDFSFSVLRLFSLSKSDITPVLATLGWALASGSGWSWRSDLHRQPPVYKTGALLLSYASARRTAADSRGESRSGQALTVRLRSPKVDATPVPQSPEVRRRAPRPRPASARPNFGRIRLPSGVQECRMGTT